MFKDIVKLKVVILVNAYDFDNTIYDGESIVDFFLFCLKKDLKLLRYLPYVVMFLIKYKLNLLSIEKISDFVEKFSNKFFENNNTDYNELAQEFWKINGKKIKPEFIKKLKKGDLIITGCPDFLIGHIKEQLKTNNIICTKFNFKTKKLEFLCFKENKVKAYNKLFKDKKIKEFYTDSLADAPFMKIAEEVYFVNQNKIQLIDKTKYIK